MAANGKKRSYKSAKRATYVSGSAARQLAPARERQVRPRREETSQERRERLRRQSIRRRENKHNLMYLTGMAIFAAVIVAICFQLVSLQSDYKANQAKLENLKQDYEDLKSSNDALDTKLNANVDYDEIYNKAVNDLGMVYPNSGQVILYDSGESEYVKQYKDLPDAK